MKITNKKIMYDLYDQGEFGNKPVTFSTIEEYRSSNFKGTLSFRNRKFTSGKNSLFIPRDKVESIYKQWIKEGYSPRDIHLTDSVPTKSRILIAGEVQRSENYYDLFYSYSQKPMRQALIEEPRNAVGLEAKLLLDHFMDPTSRDNLDYLLDKYDGHVVEFTCLEKSWGELKWNTIFWEVRLM
jgi:hypothetical protein